MVCKLYLHKAIKTKQRGAELLAQLCPEVRRSQMLQLLSAGERDVAGPAQTYAHHTFLDPVYSQSPLFPPSSPLAASFFAKFLKRKIYHGKGRFITSPPTTAPMGLPSSP